MIENQPSKTLFTSSNATSALTLAEDSLGVSYVLCTSWGGELNLFCVEQKKEPIGAITLEDEKTHKPLPITTATFVSNSFTQTCSVDIWNNLHISSFKNRKTIKVDLKINSPIFHIIPHPLERTAFIMGDREKNIYIVDIRNKNPICSTVSMKNQPESFKINSKGNLVICSNDEISLFDIRNINKSFLTRPHVNIGEVTCIECIGEESIIIGGTSGKVALNYLEPERRQNDCEYKYHLIEDEKRCFSINCVAFDQKSKVIYSGGSDGVIYGWNYIKRTKIFKSERETQPISHMVLNSKFSFMIFAVSDLNEDGHFENMGKSSNYLKVRTL